MEKVPRQVYSKADHDQLFRDPVDAVCSIHTACKYICKVISMRFLHGDFVTQRTVYCNFYHNVFLQRRRKRLNAQVYIKIPPTSTDGQELLLGASIRSPINTYTNKHVNFICTSNSISHLTKLTCMLVLTE